ncbi:MAG: right-handed parallel beta-helix repeat-containing protein [Kiritimatiellae bacterium]|nr:right-handed parallel beta-helix repeat-containing protein [Kiritimatiellia bacterium]
MKRKRRATQILVLVGILCGLCTLPAPTFAQSRLYVATDGNDAWSGTRPAPNAAGTDGPFATLERARDAIRTVKQENRFPAGGVVVEIRAGTYFLAETFRLEKEDSGTERGPVVYRAYRREPVRLLGGKPVAGFMPVTDPAVRKRLAPEAQGNVLQADLRAQGITDYGKLEPYGFRWPRHPAAAMQLFYNAKPPNRSPAGTAQGAAMTLARWPNEGWALTGEVPDPKGARTTWRYEGNRPERWINEPDGWFHGYWNVDYHSHCLGIEKIDTENHTLTAGPEFKDDWKARCKKGQRYYALNLLPELDRPGEYYIERPAGILYFWPPSPIAEGEALVSMLYNAVRLKATDYVVLDRLTIELARSDLVRITGGAHNRVIGCTLRNGSRDGVRVEGGRDNGVEGCDIYGNGGSGIVLDGGDRKTLTPAGHFAVNNHIHHHGRLSIDGVGNRVSHNLIHDAPHGAIHLGGNDHLIEFNEVHNVCYNVGDGGAFYSGRDWTRRGNVIRHNFFHHIEGSGRFGANGIYIDDEASGFWVLGNVFYKVTRAAFIGGGRDNIVQNNIFAECKPAVHVDARGLRNRKKLPPDGPNELWDRLMAMPYKKPPWSTRYPELAALPDKQNPWLPEGNVITHNICWGGKWDEVYKEARPYLKIENNLLDQDPLFVDAANMDFRLKRNSPAYRLGFKPIPFEKIGLVKHSNRASWPVEHPISTLPSEAKKQEANVYKVLRAHRGIKVDGEVTSEEWYEAFEGNAMALGAASRNGSPESRAWFRYDDQALYVAIENTVAATAPLRTGSTWPRDDAVEIAIRDTAAGASAPILVLRGYPLGQFESSDEAGAPPAAVQRAANGVQYAARVVDHTHWNTEWRIPWSSLGINPARHRRFAFNLTARKTATNQFVMWCGVGPSWNVDEAGLIELE